MLIYEATKETKKKGEEKTEYRYSGNPILRYAFITLESKRRESVQEGVDDVTQTSTEFSNLVVVGMEEYLRRTIPAEDTHSMNVVLSQWKQFSGWYERHGGVELKTCSRAEIESWLRSSDFNEEERMKAAELKHKHDNPSPLIRPESKDDSDVSDSVMIDDEHSEVNDE